MTAEARILSIVAAQCRRSVTELRLSDTPETLGLDSMALVEILFALEEDFGLSLPFNANTPEAGGVDFSTLAALISGVEAHLAEAAP
ncbi:acyl carrier protein [Falsigemmobacter faecalis]|uniref:Acyl carrier protein n=1 Tax=Falsigemmobacter faecalis TaxID=2488730 RepID=A0A3P3DKG9_9RHOB|nr:acyl carrier protein [Falsigemmobacter faecalis]RRH74757.1 acyl carrier protein [Falsigemmobacter faecalis]